MYQYSYTHKLKRIETKRSPASRAWLLDIKVMIHNQYLMYSLDQAHTDAHTSAGRTYAESPPCGGAPYGRGLQVRPHDPQAPAP